MKIKGRIISIVLTIIMVLTVIPTSMVSAEEKASSPITAWGKDQEGQLSEWKTEDCTSTLNEGGSLSLDMQNQGDPKIIKEDLNIDAGRYSQLELTYINNTGNATGQLYFFEKGADGGFQPGLGVGFEVETNTSDVKTVTIDISQNSGWKGSIEKLRLDPVNDDVNGITGEFIIVSLKFIESDTGASLDENAWGAGQSGKLNDWTYNDAEPNFEQDGSCTLNITGVDSSLSKDNLKIDAGIYKSMELTYVNNTNCNIGEAYFISDNQIVGGFQPECTVQYELESGEHTVSIPFSGNRNWAGIIEALRIDPVKDLTSGTFKIISLVLSEKPASEPERPNFWNWDEDGDFEQWSWNEKIKNPEVKNGYFILPIDGDDANISSPVMNLNTNLFPTIEIVYKNETDNQEAELFWNNGGGINQACSTTFTVENDGEWHTLRLNLSKNANWTGKITGIRIDPIREGKGIFTIDSIKFLKTSSSEGGVAIAWEWHSDGALDGWETESVSAVVENGRVMLELDGSDDPIFKNEENVEISADSYKTLELTYKNNTNMTDAEFYWGDADGNWVSADGVHVQQFTTINDGQWHTLRVPLQANEQWKGDITKLRIDPAGAGGTGTFEIDRIAVLYDGSVETGGRYEMSNGYFSLSGAKGMLDKLAFDPTGKGQYGEDLISGCLFMKMDASDVPYDVFSEDVFSAIDGNTLTISNIRFGDPEMIGTWKITLDGNKMSNTFKLDTQGTNVVLKNAGFAMDIFWENNTDEVEGEPDAPGSLKVPFRRMVSSSDRYHSVYAFKYMPMQEDVSTLGLEGEWIDWEGTNGFPFNLRFETDTKFVSPVCSVDNLRYLFRQPDVEEIELDGKEDFTRTLDMTVLESKDITPKHFARYEIEENGDSKIAKALNDMMYEFGYAREPASTQPDWWEWISLTRAWRNDNYLQPDLDKVTGVKQITEDTIVEGDPGVGYVYTWNDLKGWPFPENRDSNHYLMTTANYINAVYNYFIYNGDWGFINDNIEKMRLGMNYLLSMYDEESDLFLIEHPDHNGIGDLSDNVGGNTDPSRMKDSVGSNYWDITPYGYKSAYDNLYCYMALNRMSELEGMLDQPDRAKELKNYADKLKLGYNNAFWENDHYIQTIDSSGEKHDYGCVYLNLESINYGIASDEQNKKIMEYMDTTVTSSGKADTFSRYAFAPRVTMKDNQNWYVYLYGNPGAYGDKQLQNGGANLYTMYYELMSWVKTGDVERAYDRLESLVNVFNEDEHLQGNNIMDDGSKNQHFGEGSVGIWGEFPESGLVPIAAKDGFMGIRADKEGLKITPHMPEEMPELSLDGLDYWGLGLRVTTSNSSVTIASDENVSAYDWAVNGKTIEEDEKGLFTVTVNINSGDTVTLTRVSQADNEKPSIDDGEDDRGPSNETEDGKGSSNETEDGKGSSNKMEDSKALPDGVQGNVQTGDNTPFILYSAVLVLSAFCLGGTLILKRKKKNKL